MSQVRKLIQKLAQEERRLQTAQFVAPCVKGGKVQTRLSGLVYHFTPQPQDFEGWGVFRPVDAKVAQLVEEARLPQITQYLRLFPMLRLHLAFSLSGRTWLAYPVNEADCGSRIGTARPMPVYLTDEGRTFEQIVARWDGSALWLEETDRKADPANAERLRTALEQITMPENLLFPGLTPEMRTAYNLATQKHPGFAPIHRQKRDRERLAQALAVGGGTLEDFTDRKDHWVVYWHTSDGNHHTSAIAKSDLTVISAGVCLSGEDHIFDLQSLVAVIERRGE